MNRKLLFTAIGLTLVSALFPVATADAQRVNFGLMVQSSWHVDPPPWVQIDHNTLSVSHMNTIIEEYAGTVRLLFPWREMELSPGVIDWTVQDIYVAAAVSRGLKIHTMIYGVPEWSNNTPGCDFWGEYCSAPPDSSTHFYDFVRAIALRYGSDIATWELWNEPDLQVFWGGTMHQLRNLITDPGIAAVNSVAGTNRTFVSPGFANNPSKMKTFLNKTAGDWSFVGVHLYPNGVPNPYSWAVSKMTAYHNSKQGVTNSNKFVPFFITEGAIGTGEGYSEIQLGDWACKIIQSVLVDGTQGDMRADRVILFSPRDGLNTTRFNGVSYTDFTRKPVFYDIQDQLNPDKNLIICGNSV